MNRITKMICCFVLCIPLIAAIIIGVTNNGGFGSRGNGSDVSANDSLKTVKIHSGDGKLIREYSEKEVLQLYWNVISNGSEITDYHPIGNEVTTSFNVNYVGNVSENVYTFIMSSDNTANCVYKDINEKYFSINAEDARSLLVRDEFSSVSRYSDAFSLYFNFDRNNEKHSIEVSPDTYNWTYTRIDGEIKSKVNNDGKTELSVVKVPYKTDFDITFDSEIIPESRNIKISKDGTEIYNGIPGSAIASYLRDLSSDTVLDVVVDAKWHEGEDSKFFGNVSYRFKLMYDVPSKFTLVNKGLNAGEFTLIKVTGGDKSEVITAQSEMMPNPSKSFVSGDKQYIYLPIKSTAQPGNYTITIEEFAGTTQLNFQVRSKNFATHNNLMISPDVAGLSTESNINEYNEFIEKYINTFSQEKYWKDNDKFTSPVKGTTVCGFGDTMNIPANTIISQGMYIKGEKDSDVKAATDGVVLFAGKTDYAGNAIVIDHGVGVVSYYFNLGKVNCKAGQKVIKGTNIGTVGTTGYTPYENTVYYANSVGGSFVNPKTQLDYGIDLD